MGEQTPQDGDAVRAPARPQVGRAVRLAIAARGTLRARLHGEGTDCYRLFHGTVEGVPGLTVDRYGELLLVQTFRAPPPPPVIWAAVEAARETLGEPLAAVWNHRGRGPGGTPAGDVPVGLRDASEAGLRLAVQARHRGNDPLFFLDFRHGRRFVRARARGKAVLNLFAYTCGVGVAALAGGASRVWNVDFARSALEVGARNHQRNGQPVGWGVAGDEPARLVHEDVLPVVRQLAGLPVKGRGARRPHLVVQARQFDLVVLDPPPLAKGPFGAVDLVRDYQGVFKPALLATAPGGTLLATNNVAAVSRDDWVAALRRCADKAGRPLKSLELLAPDEDFPSVDGRHPLKVAAIGV